jgi:transcriptional regulator with XRE-family HTH domain
MYMNFAKTTTYRLSKTFKTSAKLNFFRSLLQIIRCFLGTVISGIRDQGSGIREQEECLMREKERRLERRRLDVEMRPYRRAGLARKPTNGLLRAVRLALRVPAAEIAGKMGISCTRVFDLERRELKNSATLRTMSRMAQAMGCKMVYGIVPMGGRSLVELAEERLWASVLGTEIREEGIGTRD